MTLEFTQRAEAHLLAWRGGNKGRGEKREGERILMRMENREGEGRKRGLG